MKKASSRQSLNSRNTSASRATSATSAKSAFTSKRLLLLFIFFAALMGLLVMRAAWIQLIPNARLEALRQRQFATTITLGSRRGDILDRNGHEFAASATAWSLFADPKIINEPRKVARQVAAALNPLAASAKTRQLERAARDVLSKLQNKKKRFVWIERQLDTRTKERLQELKVRGLGFIEEPKRIYPNENLMANVLGFVGAEGRGLEGLELRLNSQLSAGRNEVAMQKDARGRPLVVNGQLFTESPDGSSVTLTIDRELQFVVEKELALAMDQHQAESATAVVLDAQTSEILAMSTLPTFDPNDGIRAKPEQRRNRAITDLFEPGSTMKTFVVAGAFEQKLLEPNSKIFAENGQMKIGRRVIREADDKHKFGWITVTDLLAQSSNIGSTKIAQMLTDRGLREVYERFGFGERSGVDLPGEARGVLQGLPWRDHLLANISFGHGVSVTALQVANAYASIANGGWLKRPYIVKQIEDVDSGETIVGKPKTIRRVLGTEAVNKMRLVLTSVTSDEGTGHNARVPGFPVAGKTGTAQRVREGGRGYEAGSYLASFAGYLPANEPKFVIYVALDRPRKDYYGSSVAAPVFSRIAQFAVRRAGLAPVLISASNVIAGDAAVKARNPEADATSWRRENGIKNNAEKAIAVAIAAAEARRRRETLLSRLSHFVSTDSVGALESASLGGDAGAAATGVDAASVQLDSPLLGLEAIGGLGPHAGVGALRGDGALLLAAVNSSRPDLVGLSLREAMEKLAQAGVSWKKIRINGQGFVSRASWAQDRSVSLQLNR